MYANSSWDRGHFMEDFYFESICNITQEPQELEVPVDSSASLLW